jgi:hypothetical protein
MTNILFDYFFFLKKKSAELMRDVIISTRAGVERSAPQPKIE